MKTNKWDMLSMEAVHVYDVETKTWSVPSLQGQHLADRAQELIFL